MTVPMRLGIDASNLRGGGGVTHIVSLLNSSVPMRYGFEEVFVWGGTRILDSITEKSWLSKRHEPSLDLSMPFRATWQKRALGNRLLSAGCHVLFAPGGTVSCRFRPQVTMSRNLLPFEKEEIRRFGASSFALKLWILHFAQLRSFRKADGLIFLTKYAEKVVSRHLGKRRGKTVCIPHGVESDFFQSPRKQRSIDEFSREKPIRILYVSNIFFYKHQWHVAQAVAKLRSGGVPVALDFVGAAHEPALKRLNKTLKLLDPQAEFMRYRGAVSHEKLHEFYKNAHINLFASSCENMPNILLEAMASGRPVVSSNKGPMPELLKCGGLYFDPESLEEIYSALKKMIDSPELREEKAQAALKLAKHFSWRRCAARTFEFLAEVAREHQVRNRQQVSLQER